MFDFHAEGQPLRLLKITDDVWVSLFDIVALRSQYGGCRVLLRNSETLQVDMSPQEVVDKLTEYIGVMQRGSSG